MSTEPVVAWLDGAFLDPPTPGSTAPPAGAGRPGPGAAGIHWSDHGLTVGDGVFETVKVTSGEPFALGAHLDRLARSAAGMGIDLPERAVLERAAREVAARWGQRSAPAATARLRITVTTGPGPAGSERGTGPPTVLVTASPMVLLREPTGVVVVPWTRNEHGALAGLKTTSYGENVVALARARSSGASEAIFANTRGELCEGTGTNVFLEHGGRLVTPPLGSGCLDGVTRRLLIEALATTGTEVVEATVPVDALRGCNEAFLTSTGREVQPIASVDSVGLRQAPGPLTSAAMEAWDARFGTTGT